MHVTDVAALMKERNISGVVVCAGRVPVGVITDRDLRNKVVATGADPRQLAASSIMSAPLVTVREDEHVFEVVYKMSKHKIHRVVVVDGNGALCGVITDSDVIRMQTNTPSYLMRDLDRAANLEELAAVNRKVTELVVHLIRTGVRTRDLVRLIASIHDAVALRAIEILTHEQQWSLPSEFAFLVLGSEGRMEQTLQTDQDNAIVYGDDLPRADVENLEAFSRALIDALISIGVPECPGGMMAKNPAWRRSRQDWMDQIARWGALPNPANILQYSMFADLRTLYGDAELERQLKSHIARHIRQSSVFLAHMAKNVVGFSPPVGFFGRIKTESSGPNRGKFDVKKAGLFQITEGVKVLALEAGLLGGGTREKLDLLEQQELISEGTATDLAISYNFLSFVRLRSQVRAISEGKAPTNHIDPEELDSVERMRLKIAFSVVKSFQNLLRMRYRLNFISE
jgi:CBS domain-containing protein